MGPLDLDSSSYGYPGGILRKDVTEDRSGIELLPVSNKQVSKRLPTDEYH